MVTTLGLNAIADHLGDKNTPINFAWIGYGSDATAAALGQEALIMPVGARIAATVETTSILKPNDTVKFLSEVTPATLGTCVEIGVFTAETGGTMLLRKLMVPPMTYKAKDTLYFIVTVTIRNKAVGTDDGNW
jgi:hypothetical protein